jgi:hypothetical protein
MSLFATNLAGQPSLSLGFEPPFGTWATHGAPSSKCSNYPEAHQWQSKDRRR